MKKSTIATAIEALIFAYKSSIPEDKLEEAIADLTTQAELPMLNADGLLPCPFCGNTNIDATNYTDPSEYWMIYCPSCRILMDTVGRTKDEAFALWNQRMPATAKKKENND